jgi:hypothetical protein
MTLPMMDILMRIKHIHEVPKKTPPKMIDLKTELVKKEMLHIIKYYGSKTNTKVGPKPLSVQCYYQLATSDITYLREYAMAEEKRRKLK